MGKLLQFGIFANIPEGVNGLKDVVNGVTITYEYGLLILLACAVAAYLLGSINTAIVISKVFYRDDVRRYGSGNAGMTNMLRSFGKKAALFTLLGDLLKTVLAISLGGICLGFYYHMGIAVNYPCYLCGVACMLGHIKPVFSHFKGGKGVLCMAVMALMLCPIPALFLILCFVAIVAVSKYVSLGSVVCAAFFPLALSGWANISDAPEAMGAPLLLSLLAAAMVVICHRANIKRLWNGTENKIKLGKAKEATTETQAEAETETK